MKTPALALAFIVTSLLTTAPALLAADVLAPIKDAVLTGNILTNPATSNKKIAQIPLTKANLLGLFKVQNVSPGNAVFFVDLTTRTIILASKDGKTIYGTLLAPQVDSPDVYLSSESATQTAVLASTTVIGDFFTGNVLARLLAYTIGKQQHGSVQYQFTAYGSVDDASSPDAIISGTFRGSFTVPKQTS